jgi:predicted metal-binding membrane protein
MALLFVVGVMNLVWIAAVAIYVAFEKLLPRSEWLSRIAGVGLILVGAIVLARGYSVMASAAP